MVRSIASGPFRIRLPMRFTFIACITLFDSTRNVNSTWFVTGSAGPQVVETYQLVSMNNMKDICSARLWPPINSQISWLMTLFCSTIFGFLHWKDLVITPF